MGVRDPVRVAGLGRDHDLAVREVQVVDRIRVALVRRRLHRHHGIGRGIELLQDDPRAVRLLDQRAHHHAVGQRVGVLVFGLVAVEHRRADHPAARVGGGRAGRVDVALAREAVDEHAPVEHLRDAARVARVEAARDLRRRPLVGCRVVDCRPRRGVAHGQHAPVLQRRPRVLVARSDRAGRRGRPLVGDRIVDLIRARVAVAVEDGAVGERRAPGVADVAVEAGGLERPRVGQRIEDLDRVVVHAGPARRPHVDVLAAGLEEAPVPQHVLLGAAARVAAARDRLPRPVGVAALPVRGEDHPVVQRRAVREHRPVGQQPQAEGRSAGGRVGRGRGPGAGRHRCRLRRRRQAEGRAQSEGEPPGKGTSHESVLVFASVGIVREVAPSRPEVTPRARRSRAPPQSDRACTTRPEKLHPDRCGMSAFLRTKRGWRARVLFPGLGAPTLSL